MVPKYRLKLAVFLMLFSFGALVLAQSTSTVSDPPPMGVMPDLTTILTGSASIEDVLSQAQAALVQGTAWTQWAQDSVVLLGKNQSTDEAAINGLQSAVATLQHPQPVAAAPVPGVAAGYAIHIESDSVAGSSARPQFSTNSGADNGARLQLIGVGSFYDYMIEVPADGVYALSGRVSTSTVGAAVLKVHLESPIGISVASFTFAPATSNGWSTSPGGTVTLTAGRQRVRLVVDTLAAGANFLSYADLVKQ